MDQLAQLLDRNTEHVKRMDDAFDDLQDGQAPDLVTVCCSDSRVLQDDMVDNDEPGHIFTCGNIGNRVIQETEEGRAVSGDVLYPIAHTETKTALVIGHTGCGAVTATYRDITEGLDEPAGIQHCIDLLREELEKGIEALPDGLDDEAAVNHLVEYNVDRQVQALLDSDEVPDDVTVVGAVYDFQDIHGGERGELHVINVDGVTEVDRLQDQHPAIADRVDRRWER
ncbi:MAG: carbonic anhydrase [Candidatus Nanohaloarchaea archaeon]|nr:carbonic anhydrase [Candidatus Nanohaloarchaea archaeon]